MVEEELTLSSTDEDECDYALNRINTISASTKKQYRTSYNTWKKHTLQKLTRSSEKHIIEIVDGMNVVVGSKMNLLSSYIRVRKFYDLPVSKIQKWRDSTLKQSVDNYRKVKNSVLVETLPTHKSLIAYIKQLYADKQYLDYVLNYLMATFCVRNMDLNFFITQDQEFLKVVGDDVNILYVSNTYCKYVRRNYKTFDTYGEKTIDITNIPFRNSILMLLGDKHSSWLFENQSGTSYMSQDSINNYVLRHSYLGLGEGRICKIVILHNQNNLKRLKALSNSRGTSIDTILDWYMPSINT